MIIITDKPSGMTSQDVVTRIKRASATKIKAGHTGTLDPMCTGVLPVLTDRDTRLSDLFKSGKQYIASVILGKTSTTEDVTGEILTETPVTVTQSEFVAALSGFIGTIEQVPPMYSAIKINGKKLYELARKGIEVERNPRTVTVYGIKFLGAVGENEYSIKVDCSAGTYIRTLVADIGKKLGCGGIMSSLRRTASNGFSIESAHRLEEVVEYASQGRLSELSIEPEAAFSYLAESTVPTEGETYYLNGGEISSDRLTGCVAEDVLLRVYGVSGAFLGLGKITDNMLKSVWRK